MSTVTASPAREPASRHQPSVPGRGHTPRQPRARESTRRLMDCWGRSRHSRQQSNTDQQISFRNR